MEISIARGLTELKTLDARINKGIENIVCVSAKCKSSDKIDNIYTKEDFSFNAKSAYQSVTDLIKRQQAIKQAIDMANAKTMTTIARKQYTILDAINRKRGLEVEKELLNKMKKQYARVVNIIDINNNKVEEEAKSLLGARLTNDTKDNKNTNDQNLDFIKSYVDMKKWEIIDPLGIEKLIEKMEKEIMEFEVDVDSALNEINVITKIVIPD